MSVVQHNRRIQSRVCLVGHVLGFRQCDRHVDGFVRDRHAAAVPRVRDGFGDRVDHVVHLRGPAAAAFHCDEGARVGIVRCGGRYRAVGVLHEFVGDERPEGQLVALGVQRHVLLDERVDFVDVFECAVGLVLGGEQFRDRLVDVVAHAEVAQAAGSVVAVAVLDVHGGVLHGGRHRVFQLVGGLSGHTGSAEGHARRGLVLEVPACGEEAGDRGDHQHGEHDSGDDQRQFAFLGHDGFSFDRHGEHGNGGSGRG